jgi:hypothetical protein
MGANAIDATLEPILRPSTDQLKIFVNSKSTALSILDFNLFFGLKSINLGYGERKSKAT